MLIICASEDKECFMRALLSSTFPLSFYSYILASSLLLLSLALDISAYILVLIEPSSSLLS